MAGALTHSNRARAAGCPSVNMGVAPGLLAYPRLTLPKLPPRCRSASSIRTTESSSLGSTAPPSQVGLVCSAVQAGGGGWLQSAGWMCSWHRRCMVACLPAWLAACLSPWDPPAFRPVPPASPSPADVTVGVTALRVNGEARENGHHPISVCEGHANMIERQATPAVFAASLSVLLLVGLLKE